ncbi:MAG: preprotein translocase subunit SecG [Alphaproteobacteria bacterium]|jgi:preprotein translocase subunit SecG|tara:strand:+ start:131 stop:493 length:363 start_codon:yes stop_codon:yes gene_type:complete
MFAIVLSIHIIICAFLIIMILLQRSEGGGLGIGQTGSGGGLGDYLSARSTSNILTKTTSFLALCFFLTSFSLVLISNKEYKKESIIDSSEDSIIDRLDLIPEEFDVEKQDDKEGLSVPSE